MGRRPLCLLPRKAVWQGKIDGVPPECVARNGTPNPSTEYAAERPACHFPTRRPTEIDERGEKIKHLNY